MSREEMLNELLKKVMKVVEANKYNLSSGVREMRIGFSNGKVRSSDYYDYDGQTFKWRITVDAFNGDTIQIFKNPNTEEYSVQVSKFYPDLEVEKYDFFDNCMKKTKGGYQRYETKDILESEQIFEEIIGKLQFLLDAFTYDYDEIKDDDMFTSKLYEIYQMNLAVNSKVGGHIDTYMRKIAHAIETGAEIDSSLGHISKSFVIGLPTKFYSYLANSSIKDDDYSLARLTYKNKSDEKGDFIQTDVRSLFKKHLDFGNYKEKAAKNSVVLRELIQMRLYDPFCEFTSGLSAEAPFRDVESAIFLRSFYPRKVYKQTAEECNRGLIVPGEIFPDSCIIKEPGKTI